MKKIGLLLIFLILSNCANYKPVIDTAGRSGTFNEDKAKEITNDRQHCEYIAKKNSSFLGNIVYWIESPSAETKYESLYKKCLNNRGHSVLN